MVNKNIFLQFLYLLSSKDISNYLYLEGGAVLSFVYDLDRVFSNDLDFTIEDYSLKLKLLDAVEEIAIEMNKKYICNTTSNKIIIKDGKEIILQIDFYPLLSELFTWEEKKIFYNKNNFFIKTHSLEDIFAEKITNVLQENRCEFKDIFDINNIYNTLIDALDKQKFKVYLYKKLVGKEIYHKIKNDPLATYLNKKVNFEKSYKVYNKKAKVNFELEFISCSKVMKLYL